MPFLKDLEKLEANDDGPHAYLEDRDTLGHWASRQVEKGKMEDYRSKNNFRSLDGLGGLKAARRSRGEIMWLNDFKLYLRQLSYQWDAILIGMLLAFALVFLGGGLPLLEKKLLPLAGLR